MEEEEINLPEETVGEVNFFVDIPPDVQHVKKSRKITRTLGYGIFHRGEDGKVRRLDRVFKTFSAALDVAQLETQRMRQHWEVDVIDDDYFEVTVYRKSGYKLIKVAKDIIAQSEKIPGWEERLLDRAEGHFYTMTAIDIVALTDEEAVDGNRHYRSFFNLAVDMFKKGVDYFNTHNTEKIEARKALRKALKAFEKELKYAYGRKDAESIIGEYGAANRESFYINPADFPDKVEVVKAVKSPFLKEE